MPAPIVAAAAGAARVAGQAAARAGAAAGRAGAHAAKKGAQAGAQAAKRGGQKTAGAAAKGAKTGAQGAAKGARAGAAGAGRAGGRAAVRQAAPRGGWAYQGQGGSARPGSSSAPGQQPAGSAPASQIDIGGVAETMAKRLGRAGLRRVLLRRGKKDKGRGSHPAKRIAAATRKARRRLLTVAVLLLFVMPMALGAFGSIHASESQAAQGAMAGEFGQVSGIPYAEVFNQTASLGIDPRLVAAVAWVESGQFDPDVIACRRASRAGALGIMQFMPATAEEIGIDPCEPVQAIPAGARYLLEQYETFGSWELALAAYNAGPGRVEAAGGIPDIAETKAYVPKVLDQWDAYKAQFPGGEVASGAGPPGGPRGGTERYTERGLPARTQRLLDAVVPKFGRGYGIGCFGSRQGPSEHPSGRACDFMMSTLGTRATGDDLAHGDAMAAWLQANAAELDIMYIIWKNHIWSPSRADEGWRHQHSESGNDNTFLHYDHIHVSLN